MISTVYGGNSPVPASSITRDLVVMNPSPNLERALGAPSRTCGLLLCCKGPRLVNKPALPSPPRLSKPIGPAVKMACIGRAAGRHLT